MKTVKICSLSLLLCDLKRELGLSPAGGNQAELLAPSSAVMEILWKQL